MNFLTALGILILVVIPDRWFPSYPKQKTVQPKRCPSCRVVHTPG